MNQIIFQPKWADDFNRYAAGETGAIADMSLRERILYAAWACQKKGGKLGLETSLGDQAIVSLHAVQSLRDEGFDLPIVFIDTGYQHPETIDYATTLNAMGYDINVYKPLPFNQLRADGLVKTHEAEWRDILEEDWSQEGEQAFFALGRLTKVEPSQRAKDELGITLYSTGRRRDQSEKRSELPIFAFDEENTLIEFNPLADWSKQNIHKYITNHDLLMLRHPFVLENIGYRPGYRFEQAEEKNECGLHQPTDQKGIIQDVSGQPLILSA